ncbi:MAG: DUF805 domain-containing protein [Patescibacteria group bacterium]|nr:DUF805 domain-containing protein [Patescibacteria group bacterium]
MNEYISVLKKYVVFSGRAGRREYWMFFLFNLIAIIILAIIDRLVWGDKNMSVLGSLYSLAVLLPSLGVAFRRLHDTNRSGWWILISLIPIIGTIVLIVLLALRGDKGNNKYGPEPKAVPSASPAQA